ncbi:unnamed protein product [Callosobruchus maculatus]|uniref:Uncharacterized protein n=1 Tax=Callosobruchus maculatus TaxID=64391 RepID=A0A653C471_CALMS|nr:unnamed protein product [Callosobruchus maculatus]
MTELVEQQNSGINGAIFPPNKCMEPRIAFSKKPVVYDHLLYLDFDTDGNSILGCSDLTGTFWEGTLLYFDKHKKIEDLNFSGYYINTTSSDGKLINQNTIAVAEDTGNLNILSVDTSQEGITLKSIASFKVIERIPQLAVWDNSNKVLCCSGRTITIADVNSYSETVTHRNVHLENVTTVDTLRSNTNIFASGGRDHITCTWDLREEKPSVLYTNEFSSVTSVAWNQHSDNYIMVGVQAGDIYLIDKREPKEFVSVFHCFDAPVTRMAFKDSSKLAICGEVNEVLVLSCDNSFLELAHKYDNHKDQVKDVKWYNSTLFTCGFGKCLMKHGKEEQ